jgi:hypothetical protein
MAARWDAAGPPPIAAGLLGSWSCRRRSEPCSTTHGRSMATQVRAVARDSFLIRSVAYAPIIGSKLGTMRIAWHKRQTWRAGLSALLAVTVAVAPLVAQALMATHNHADVLLAGSHASSGHSGSEHVHSHSSHDHQHGDNAPEHSHEAGAEASLGLIGHHDHADGAGAGCCGTLCHSAFVLTAAVQLSDNTLRPTFEWANKALLAAVDPDQPQRPPSILLSF